MVPLDDAVQRLKNEILSQDWRLSPHRIERLEEAFSCLRKRFSTRKAMFSILTMAVNVLHYKKRKGDECQPEAIDFLKESMAHVVNLYEDIHYGPEKDEKVFQLVYNRFLRLKGKIKTHGKEKPFVPDVSGAALREEPETEDNTSDAATYLRIQQTYDHIATDIDLLQQEMDSQITGTEVANLVDELQKSLNKAETLSATLKSVLTNLGRKKADEEQLVFREIHGDAVRLPQAPGFPEAPERGGAQQEDAHEKKQAVESQLLSCPPTGVLEFVIGNVSLAVQQHYVSGIKALDSNKRTRYLKSSSVPLSDFHRFMRSLAAQFQGSLGQIPDRKLKRLSLPVMIPRGGNLDLIPDDAGRHLLFLSNGPWHGVLIVSEIKEAGKRMVKFRKNMDGDIAGIGFTPEGEPLAILSITSVLQREGFLVMT